MSASQMSASKTGPFRQLGRYLLCDQLASGGMSTVHVGRLLGAAGFTRTVAIKRLHARLVDEPEFGTMLIDEGRLAARVRHPNVVQTLDVVEESGELFLVMDYVSGESLSVLLRAARAKNQPVPPPVAGAVLAQALLGLHAAHQAEDDHGHALGIVHRDVSPQNLLVGSDGVTRVLDFGIAKAASRLHTTRQGQLKGKLAYMAPEQLLRRPVDCRTDVFAAGIVLWEVLTGEKLFAGDDHAATIAHVLEGEIRHPIEVDPDILAALADVAMRALARNPDERFATALEMAVAIEAAVIPATALNVAGWVEGLAGDRLAARARRVTEIESSASLVTAELALPEAGPRAAAELTATDLSASAVPIATSKRSMKKPLAWLAFGLVAIAGAAGFFMVHGSWRQTTRAPAPATTLPQPSPTLPPESSVPPTEAAASSNDAPMPKGSATPTSPAGRRSTRTPIKSLPRPSAKPPCQQWTIDERGEKHFNPDCF